MQGFRAAMRYKVKQIPGNREQDGAVRGICQIELVPKFHQSELRLTEEIADTVIMVQSIRQFVCIVLFVFFCFPLYSPGQSSTKSDVLRYLSDQSSFLRYSRFRGEPAPSKELRAILERQARWDASGLNDSNGSGSHLRFEKIDEQVTPGGRVAARYRVFAEGAPQDKVFVLHTALIDNTISTDPRDIYLNSQGLLMLHKPKPEEESSLKAGDDELVVVSATENAEPMRFLLSRRDGETPIYGTLVLHPMESYDQGCRLEVRVAQPGATAVLISIDGFPAKSKVPLVLESEGAAANEVLDTNSDGHSVIAVVPLVPGKTQGTLKASAEGPNCLPSVVLPWNAAAHADAKTPEH